MIDLSNNAASIQKRIPPKKLFDENTIEKYMISDVVWVMSIKPGIRNVDKEIDGRLRLEEIEAFIVRIQQIPDTGGFRDLLSQIHSKIMYPCVVFFEYKNKYKISAWKTIDSTRSSGNKEILTTHYLSAWIYEPSVSENATRCANAVKDLLLNGEGSIKALYDQICNAIMLCVPQYIGSREHLLKILYDLSGNKNDPIAAQIDHTKRHSVKNPNARYKKKEYGTAFQYAYEYEDIWFALMNDNKFRKIIESRRYRSIEDLILHIDLKYRERS